ncbi:unnamed protein product [Acanthoscelides obtectus]|uniref:Serine/threonine-protein phosphatase 2A regulatory subunit B'' subunit gamma n=1 Tax=Acanthoscelides obtectus TaxID=200917 RepID=A0A9P0M575_ACAOB|nr:unnamed protein product [Acanthoscelides obtectus]CAK1638927.1 Serine/threonine-protein phosphatase 2A regulatory subunit B'' subunit gamma [Acanthoscelides obtectus]
MSVAPQLALLRKRLEEIKVAGKSKEELQAIEDSKFQQCLKEWTAKRQAPPKGIPRFFERIPKETEPLRMKLRDAARTNLFKRKSLQLLDNDDLKELYVLLDQNQSFPEEQLMTYADFQKVQSLAREKVKPYLTAHTFAKLQQGDPQGRIPIMSIFNYVMHKVWLDQTRVGLSLFDATGQGYLTSTDLENYIIELLPNLPQLKGLEESFHSFYVCTAVSKFLFFLDVARAGRIRILDRVFETCLTYAGEMDYKTYLDLVLALENRAEPQALAFLFKILDIKEERYLDAFTLNYFFRGIQEQMKAHGSEAVSFEDVKDELFDMVRPADPEKITLADLVACGQGDTFVSILIEFHGFWTYENREAMSSEPSQD